MTAPQVVADWNPARGLAEVHSFEDGEYGYLAAEFVSLEDSQEFVRRYNLHDELVKALTQTHYALRAVTQDRPTAHTDGVWLAVNEALTASDAAIALARVRKEGTTPS